MTLLSAALTLYKTWPRGREKIGILLFDTNLELKIRPENTLQPVSYKVGGAAITRFLLVTNAKLETMHTLLLFTLDILTKY